MQHNLYHDNINSLLLLLKYSFHLFFQDARLFNKRIQVRTGSWISYNFDCDFNDNLEYVSVGFYCRSKRLRASNLSGISRKIRDGLAISRHSHVVAPQLRAALTRDITRVCGRRPSTGPFLAIARDTYAQGKPA